MNTFAGMKLLRYSPLAVFIAYLFYSNLAIPYGFSIAYLRPIYLLLFGCVVLLFLVPIKRLHLFFFHLSLFVIIVFIQIFFNGGINSLSFINLFVNWLLLTFFIEGLVILDKNVLKAIALSIILVFIFLWPKRYDVPEGSVTRVYFSGTTFDNPNTFALWLGFAALIFFYWGQNKPKIFGKIFFWGLSLLSLYFLSQSFSRGAILGLGIALIFSIKYIKKKDLAIILILILLTILTAKNNLVLENVISGYQLRINLDTGRTLIWKEAFNHLMNHPFTGVGIDSVEILIPSLTSSGVSPHNSFLQIGLASGLIPLFVLLAEILLLLFISLKSQYKGSANSYSFPPLPLWFYSVIGMFMISEAIYAPWCVAAFAFIIHVNEKSIYPKRVRK